MQQEQTMVPVVIADGGAGLVIGAQVGQFVIAPESLEALAPMPPVM